MALKAFRIIRGNKIKVNMFNVVKLNLKLPSLSITFGHLKYELKLTREFPVLTYWPIVFIK